MLKKSTPKPTRFVFAGWEQVSPQEVHFTFRSEFEGREALSFTERIVLPAPILMSVPHAVLDRILDGLQLALGVSYFKLYCPPEITVEKQTLTADQAAFWTTVYRKGLGEFCYRNGIDLQALAAFPVQAEKALAPLPLPRRDQSLVCIGGGKDSIVAAELLKELGHEFTTLVTDTEQSSPITRDVVQAIGAPTLAIRRFLDPQIFTKHPGSYNGHVPISSIFAWLGVLTAALHDFRYVVVANEYSSNFGNLEYQGEVINHQWSKSAEFETLFQGYVRDYVTPDITYYSAIRSFYEIRVVELFTHYPQYFPLFSSCNRSFKVHEERSTTRWCGECDKCVFVFTLLAAFLPPEQLEPIFQKNLFNDEKLLPQFANILGLGDMKPFDCVGTFEEAQAALYLARENWGDTLVVKTFIPKLSAGSLPREASERSGVFKAQDAPTIPARFRFLGLKNVLLAGYGKEGKESEQYLKIHYPNLEIGIADQTQGEGYLDKQIDYDIVVKTPGLPQRLLHIPHTTATNIFFSHVLSHSTIGITGSKGKSTTASLIAHILKEAGKPVELIGNIGRPMLSVLKEKIAPDTIFVIEMSSFQLEDSHYSPHIAVALTLFPEHMDYHGTIEAYYAAKKNITMHQAPGDVLVYNQDDVELQAWASETKATPVPFVALPDNVETKLQGHHNLSNIRAAITVARHVGIAEEVITKAVASFVPLPHRLQYLGEFKGIHFYDDAISTTPESTIAAIDAIPNIDTLFLGGEDRGYDFTALEAAIRQAGIKNIVLFPTSGARIFTSREGFNVLETESMAEAVQFAYTHTAPGRTCVLSCASPSYSLWKNFEEKGEQFQRFVKEYGSA